MDSVQRSLLSNLCSNPTHLTAINIDELFVAAVPLC